MAKHALVHEWHIVVLHIRWAVLTHPLHLEDFPCSCVFSKDRTVLDLHRWVCNVYIPSRIWTHSFYRADGRMLVLVDRKSVV